MSKKKQKKRPKVSRVKRQRKEGIKTGKDKAVEERNRIALAFMELGGDKTFQKLPEEEKLALVKEVIAIGDEVASWVASEYGTNDPRKIASKMGVKVFGEDRGKKKPAEYRKDKREIVVYRDFHEKLIRKVESPELSENLLKFLVAHELFHHLELDRVGQVYKRFKFKTWKIGPYIREKSIKGLSNVAAQAFTLTLLKLDISPEVFDYLTYILHTNLS